MNDSNNTYAAIFNTQKANQYHVGKSSCRERIKKLKALQYAIQKTYRKEIREALYKDFRKPQVEVDITEVYLAVKEIKHTISNLR